MQHRAILTLTLLATATLTANRFADYDGGLPSDGGNAMGVVRHNGVSGENVAVIVQGTAPVEVSGAISKGDLVEVGADGRIETQSAGVSVGRALEASTAAGQVIEVLLLPN